MDKIGIAISTYFGSDTHPARLNIFLASIHSLLASGFDGKIVVVDDASPTDEHLNRLYGITDRIKYIKRTQNTEIAHCKNECIKALSDCDYLFLSDDDMLYNGNWWEPYISASKKTGIEHFCYYVPQLHHIPPAKVEVYRGVKLTRYTELNGCLMFMTRRVINEIGMFKDAGKKYWLEHPQYTQRCVAAGKMPFYCDVYGSRFHLRLNRSSYEGKSVVIDNLKGHLNTAMAYDRLYAETDYDAPYLTGNEPKWPPIKSVIDRMKPRRSIIDLGCGRGWYLRKLKELGHIVFGVEQAKSCCTKYLTDIPHMCSNISSFLEEEKRLGFPRKYDVLMNTDVIEHIAEKEINWTIENLSCLANFALYGVTNSSDKDELTGEELHLCIHDRTWWTEKLKAYYKTVEYIPDPISYHNEYFLLYCSGSKKWI
jgi:2-polyprenyl-3-methyl-5-hydroxy-6-metoxy-1,4-benzoquinol methylase